MKCYLIGLILFLSCSHPKKDNSSISAWILAHKQQLSLATDTLLEQYKSRNLSDSFWTSATVAVNKHYVGVLGELTQMAEDSTDCIITLITFYSDKKQKRQIRISAEDSSCLPKLNSIVLNTDSTKKFIYGKRSSPLE